MFALAFPVMFSLGTYAAADDATYEPKVKIGQLAAKRAGDNVVVTMKLDMNDLNLKSDMLLAYTPIVTDGNNTARLRPLLVTGRNEHYKFLRSGNKNYPDAEEVWRRKGKKGEGQTYEYSYVLPYEEWMEGAKLYVDEDLCGGGDQVADNRIPGPPLDFDPESGLLTAFVTPQVEARKTREEKGTAYVDFPVDKIVL